MLNFVEFVDQERRERSVGTIGKRVHGEWRTSVCKTWTHLLSLRVIKTLVFLYSTGKFTFIPYLMVSKPGILRSKRPDERTSLATKMKCIKRKLTTRRALHTGLRNETWQLINSNQTSSSDLSVVHDRLKACSEGLHTLNFKLEASVCV